MATVIGYPLAAGMVMISIEQTRNGFPTPLPPWIDWSTRYLIGLFALLIDVTFFVFPLCVAGILLLCIGLSSIIGGVALLPVGAPGLLLVGLVTGGFLLTMFLSSVAPVARLRFAREGKIEEALSMQALRRVWMRPARRFFWQARLASLPVYLPTLLLAGLLVGLSRFSFPGQGILLIITIWLMCSTLLYAHLVLVQLYVAAEQAIADAEMRQSRR